jgi:hypothetical protein
MEQAELEEMSERLALTATDVRDIREKVDYLKEAVAAEHLKPNKEPTLRREAPCYIPGVAGRDLEDIPGSDGLPGSER